MKFPLSTSEIPSLPDDVSVFWFRRDLRLKDNAGLYRALTESKKVLPVFIFDTVILDALEDRRDRRVQFIYEALKQLHDELISNGSTMLVLNGDPVEIFAKLSAAAVYTNHDYESYARNRDGRIENLLAARNIPFRTSADHVFFEKSEVVKSDGKPYTVFTPYSRVWKARLQEQGIPNYPSEKHLHRLLKAEPFQFPALSDLGFEPAAGVCFPPRVIRKSIITSYAESRNYPAVNGTTRLGVHLRFGTVSVRELVRIASKTSETWLNELIWRDFFAMILWSFPHVEKGAFKPAYDRIQWRNDPEEFRRWCEGVTGYPIVDAGMRELNETGFMHNRVRMIVASFLTKHLLIDWRWGEAYFAGKLLDFDLASNNGGWQWAAGSGCDASPYFRVFNPELQTGKFDKDFAYIRKWVPEYGTHSYPSPVVIHADARARAIRVYKEAVG